MRGLIRTIQGAGWARLVGLSLLSLAATGAVGCAEEREPINRVQPNALAKSFFVGADYVDTGDDPAFYARAAITDVGYGAAQDGLFTSTYAQPTSVIKWEITEDMLVGRIVYNRIINADNHGDSESSIDGQVAYAFPILGHFDIRRDYNPSTGEETNVIVENTSDRPWNQRDYFRVDWSRNLNTDAYDFDTLSLVGVYGGVTYEPLSYYVNDPNHPDAPHFATSEGYFDITTKVFATPGLIDLSHLGWGINTFPACYLPNDVFGGSQPFGNCNPTELTLRMSFRRAEPSDYQPADWDGNRFRSFGIFYGERFGYARNYGITDNQWYRLAARYNIWEKHHYYKKGEKCGEGLTASEKFPGQCEVACFTSETTPPGADPNRDEDGDGTADECALVGNGSQCDRFEQKCTLPYRDRKEVPVVWHFTKGSQPEYFESTEWATHEWDIAMRTAVVTAKYAECVKMTGDVATCEAEYPMYRGQQDENQDAIELSREGDDCKKAKGAWADRVKGEPWSKSRIEKCNGEIDSIGGARGYSAGVIEIAKQREMVTLCHSPVQFDDSPLCVADIQRLMPEEVKAKDTRKVLPEGVTAAECDEQFELRFDHPEKVDQELLATCDNGFTVRIGDLRYHQVNIIRNPQTPSPWGIMADSDDPRTGEKVHASINVWAHVNDLASQGLVDTLGYIAGEIPVEEITDGTYVKDWAAAAQAASGKGSLGTMDRATVERRKLGMFDGRSLANGTPNFDAEEIANNPRKLDDIVKQNPEAIAQARQYFNKKLASTVASGEVQSVDRPYIEARRLAGQNTPTEAALITKPMMQLAGMNKAEIQGAGTELAAGQVGSSVLASASVLRNLNPSVRRDFERARELGLAARGACILSSEQLMAPAPNTLADLTKVMERKFGPWTPGASKADRYPRQEAMRKYIAQRYNYAVIAHEMGHSIGLRHNFVSSYYAFGFRPQYWQLRTKNGTVTEKCTDVSATGEECVGPRYFDPPTETELSNLIWMFQQSTVMDYPGELTQDMIGLGAYDFAAARFFYGDVMSVFNDGAKYGVSNTQTRATLLNITDTFGGIVGYQFVGDEYLSLQGQPSADTIHYSQLNDQLELINGCTQVDPEIYKPVSWDDAALGTWDSLMDGLIVSQNGTATKCKTPTVDYVAYDSLRPATSSETGAAGFYGTGGKAVEKATGKLRVPYGFATDSWADLGNLSVYRHDAGADPYELFNFLITEQEARHIFDNYRRGRTTFSVRTQSGRILGRYNEKMRDGAKGLGLFSNIYRQFFLEIGYDYDSLWPGFVNLLFPENILASGIAFDHFTRQFTRPQTGAHGFYQADDPSNPYDRILRAHDAALADPGNPDVAIFDGGSGYFGQVVPGGKLVENRLSEDQGEFDRDYTMNVGSYYDKVYAPYLLTESVDNFISDSLGDFIDPRQRAVSMADLFPDGYRRFLANQLTLDDYVKGTRIAASASGAPQTDAEGYPSQGIGWVSWWTPTPEVCFPGPTATLCTSYGCPSGTVCEVDGNLAPIPHDLNPFIPANTAIVDPQVGWEEHKWLIAQTLLYLPENARTQWVDMMGIWELGADNDPGFDNRIELHTPDGRIYIAKTFGTEDIFGKTVQRGVGARVLEYANELASRAFECTDVAGADGYSHWCLPTVVAGKPVVKYDPLINDFDFNPTCTPTDNSGCTCTSNHYCDALQRYNSVPAFMRQAMRDFRMADASMKGIYD
ncbi:MAG: zinc-dependent metalloprotease [Myxococcales bacterium]|nr:zinc-dependent metalloprotease [Myxococcales bacterium]